MSGQYELRHAPEGYDGNGPDVWGILHSRHPTLSAAMLAAGHLDPAHWHTAVDIHDALFIDWVLYFDRDRDYEDTEYLTPRWVIQAPGVADEFTKLVTSDVGLL